MGAIPASVSAFLSAAAEQKDGFRFSDPERVTPDALSVVVPILRKTSQKRQYVLLSEAQAAEPPFATVVDTGSISRMKVKNTGKENVFARSGTIFRGGTQERALTRSAIIFAGKEADLDVRCVHRSKGIQPGAKVVASGYTPLGMDQSNYGDGYAAKGQQEFWQNVDTYSDSTSHITGRKPREREVKTAGGILRAANMVSRRMGPTKQSVTSWVNETTGGGLVAPPDPGMIGSGDTCFTSSLEDSFDTAGAAELLTAGVTQTGADDLATTIDDVASNLDDLLSKVKHYDNQVGLALITEKGLQCVELFDVPDSWSAIHKDAVKRVGSDLANKDKENTFEFKPRAALNTVAAVLAQDWAVNEIFKHKPSNGEPPVRIFGLTAAGYVGEIVEIDGKVMHLSIIKLAV